MGLFSRNKTNFNWHILKTEDQLDELVKESHNHPVMLFKHSTRCSISMMAKNRVESGWRYEEGEVAPYYLDLITYRSVSNEIASKFGVYHQSPQVIVLKDGEVVYHASHSEIQPEAFRSAIS